MIVLTGLTGLYLLKAVNNGNSEKNKDFYFNNFFFSALLPPLPCIIKWRA